MNKTRPKSKTANQNPVLDHELNHRLAELEAELSRYLSNPDGPRLLKELGELEPVQLGSHQAVRFSLDGSLWATGHSDTTYSESNHARGVRSIRLYQGDQVVLHIEGDFEDQQFGSNFRFQTVQIYVPGPWEKPFMALTDRLRTLREKRRLASKKKRDALR